MTTTEMKQHVETLKQEIVMLNNQIDILESDAFADTVPEKETFINAIQDYIGKANDKIEEFTSKINAEQQRAVCPFVGTSPVAANQQIDGKAVITGILKLLAQAAQS